MKAFLAKVVDIWYASYTTLAILLQVEIAETYGSPPGSCRFDIHRAIAAHRFSLVPDPSQHSS